MMLLIISRRIVILTNIIDNDYVHCTLCGLFIILWMLLLFIIIFVVAVVVGIFIAKFPQTLALFSLVAMFKNAMRKILGLIISKLLSDNYLKGASPWESVCFSGH